MKNIICKLSFPTVVLSLLLIFSCNKKEEENKPGTGSGFNYTSLSEFYKANAVKSQFFTINAVSGGTFTSSKGTKVTIPPNGLTDELGNPITGNVKVEFKDIYDKSDMLLSQMPTMLAGGMPLKSGGEFFINIEQNGKSAIPAPNKPVVVEQPTDSTAADTAMRAFVWLKDGWVNTANQLGFSPQSYIMSLYNFATPVGSGTWCNSDNPYFFDAFPQTKLTVNPTVNPADYSLDVYLVFKNINSMVHVYGDGNAKYPYDYAPVGLQCTVVGIGYKNNKLYASFTDITISANQTVNISVAETTEAEFKSKLTALNN